MSIEIHYSTDVAHRAFPLDFFIDAKGVANLSVGTNRDNPEYGVVGLFRKRLERSQIDGLIAALRSSDFINIQNPASALPGESVRKLSIKEEGHREVTKWVSFQNPDPPAFLSAEGKALAVVDLARQHPIHAITMKLSPTPDKIERGKPIQFDMTIINSGSEIVQLPPPESWTEEVVKLRLIGLRSDLPLDQLEPYHQKFEDLSKKNLLKIEGTKVKKPLITLPPANHVVFTFRTNLDWPPGQYDLHLSLIAPLLDEKGVEQIRGQLLSKTFPIKVSGKSKPGDEPEDLEEEEGNR